MTRLLTASSACDVCGGHADGVTTIDRAVMPDAAGWLRLLCGVCRKRFRRAPIRAAVTKKANS